MIDIEARLDELRLVGMQRRTRLVSGPQGPRVLLDGNPVLLLCSSNYLGLADHPAVREAAAEAAMRWGVGAGSSRLVCGTMTIHRRLEERLAAFQRRAAALVFGSGYLANVGCIRTLARPGEVIFCDEHSHPSIVDGCRLSGAEVFGYQHCDVEHLQWGVEQAEGRGALIVTDSVFSIDGDVAPLAEIVGLAQRFRLRTLVDEAQATGVLGPGGRGALAEAGLADQVDLIVGTLGTALGSYGAFVACDATMARYLINAARTWQSSSALPPSAAAAALAAFDLLQERPHRISRLAANAAALRDALGHEGFAVPPARTPILSLVIGDPQLALRICEAAFAGGVVAQAIGPPTVAPTTSRLRLTVMATHREEELRAAARTLGAACRAAGLDPRARLAAVQEPVDDRPQGGDEPTAVRGPGHVQAPPARAGVFDFEAPEPIERAA